MLLIETAPGATVPPPPAAAASCWDTAMTTAEMSACAASELAATEAALADTMAKIRARHAGNARLLVRLDAAQAAWAALRDGDLEAIYWPENPMVLGSHWPVCHLQIGRAMTQQRIEALQPWLTPPSEGDICDGPYAPDDP